MQGGEPAAPTGRQVRTQLPSTAYLAGPMRGIKEFNFPAFRRATKILRDKGITIISPHELDESAGYFWEGFTGNEYLAEFNFDLVERLTEDIHAIGEVDAVILLDGWSNSSGASAEASFAWAVGKSVFQFEEGNRMNGFTNSLLQLSRGTIIALEHDPVEWEG